MKKKVLLLAVFTVLTVLAGCLRVEDSAVFNPNKLTEYKLDNYIGEVDFRLDYSYNIPANLIHLFTLPSKTADESSPTTIYAIYIGDISHIATDTVIMYCHGNKWHMDFYWQRAKLLANTGAKNRYGVMMVDYRGYGMSEGKPTENGMYADVEVALKWLQANGLSNNRLLMYGFSLGSAPATKLTAEPRNLIPSKLMLEAPFANAETMIQDASAMAMPSSFFTNLQLNNGEEIKMINQPFFWIHGIDDDFLNINTHGQVVYDNYKGTYKEAHKIAGAGHSTIQTTMDFAAYSTAVNNFITHH